MDNIINNLLKATKSGPATQWNDRLAKIAEQAELPLQNINWIGSPASIAQRIAKYANDYGGSQKEFFENNFNDIWEDF
jgi:predicted DsbA family dithiol-disulfide isomerase